jgi:hypothetical protein
MRQPELKMMHKMNGYLAINKNTGCMASINGTDFEN